MRKLLTHTLASAVVAAGVLSAAPALAQQEFKLTICSGQAAVFPFIQQITKTFIPTVNAELAKTGKVKLSGTKLTVERLPKLVVS